MLSAAVGRSAWQKQVRAVAGTASVVRPAVPVVVPAASAPVVLVVPTVRSAPTGVSAQTGTSVTVLVVRPRGRTSVLVDRCTTRRARGIVSSVPTVTASGTSAPVVLTAPGRTAGPVRNVRVATTRDRAGRTVHAAAKTACAPTARSVTRSAATPPATRPAAAPAVVLGATPVRGSVPVRVVVGAVRTGGRVPIAVTARSATARSAGTNAPVAPTAGRSVPPGPTVDGSPVRRVPSARASRTV